MNRRLLLTLAVMAGLGVAANQPKTAPNPDLLQVKTIYLLPMSGGLDQYLTNWLTREGHFQVVTDPQDADAILTDRVGEAFESRMAALYPPEKEEPKVETKGKDGKEKSKEDIAADRAEAQRASDMETIRASQQEPRVSSFSSSKGNVFLVHAVNRKVIWSSYRRVKSRGADDMNRVAEDLAKQLVRDSSPVVAKP
jgi:hypothetical protein